MFAWYLLCAWDCDVRLMKFTECFTYGAPFVQEPSVRASPSQQHRRRDSTPTTFGDLGILHPGGERIIPPPQPMHTRRHSAAGALTGLLNESPAAEQRLRQRMRQEDMDAVRSARTQARLKNAIVGGLVRTMAGGAIREG